MIDLAPGSAACKAEDNGDNVGRAAAVIRLALCSRGEVAVAVLELQQGAPELSLDCLQVWCSNLHVAQQLQVGMMDPMNDITKARETMDMSRSRVQ